MATFRSKYLKTLDWTPRVVEVGLADRVALCRDPYRDKDKLDRAFLARLVDQRKKR